MGATCCADHTALRQTSQGPCADAACGDAAIYFLQQWYDLSDPGAEEAPYDIHSRRDFAGLNLGQDAVPDEATILNFRHFLERHNITETLFGADAEYLE